MSREKKEEMSKEGEYVQFKGKDHHRKNQHHNSKVKEERRGGERRAVGKLSTISQVLISFSLFPFFFPFCFPIFSFLLSYFILSVLSSSFSCPQFTPLRCHNYSSTVHLLPISNDILLKIEFIPFKSPSLARMGTKYHPLYNILDRGANRTKRNNCRRVQIVHAMLQISSRNITNHLHICICILTFHLFV